MAPNPLLYLLAAPPLLLLLALCVITRPKKVRVPIKGRHVFVTGGSVGIGLAIAQQAAAAGARVSILARSRPKLEEARDAIKRATGAEVGIYSADVRDMDAVKAALDEAGTVDVLVCNHGVYFGQELHDQSLDVIKFTLDVNLLGNFHLLKAALPAMRKRDGRPRSVAFISSQAGQLGFYGYTAYCSSKFALRGLAEALQHELITDDIHVSVVYPPATDTPRWREDIASRPEISNIISESSTAMNTDEVAKKTLGGIMSGKFNVTCNLEGTILTIATAGFSPQRSALAAFFEIAFAPIARFAGLCFQYNWFGIIYRRKAEEAKIKNT